MSTTQNTDTVTLANGVVMPKRGFGVFQIPDNQTVDAVKSALSLGYRLIDTAQSYFNEEAVGQALEESEVPRDQIFLTTKVWIDNYGYEKTKQSVVESLRKLRTDYLDLLLLHQPFSDYYGAYRAIEDLYKEGIIRAIGVSNFAPDRLMDIALFNEIAPMVNQVEVNLFQQQQSQLQTMQELGVQAAAWAPFGEGRNGMFTNPTLVGIANAHGKSVAQIILRWLWQRDIVSLAKSMRPERMQENFMIEDFALSDEDMQTIAAEDTNTSLFFNHQTPEAVKMMKDLVVARRK